MAKYKDLSNFIKEKQENKIYNFTLTEDCTITMERPDKAKLVLIATAGKKLQEEENEEKMLEGLENSLIQFYGKNNYEKIEELGLDIFTKFELMQEILSEMGLEQKALDNTPSK